MQFNFRKMMLAATALTAVVGATAPSAHAGAPITFAQFFQTNPSANLFSLTQSGGTTTFTATNADVTLSLNGTVYTNALLTLTSSTTATATKTAGTDSLALNNVTIKFLKGGVNLLTTTASVATLSGTDGGNSAGLSASLPPDSVNFTSDVVSFPGSTARNFGLSFSSVTPVLSLNSSNYLNNFVASGTGTFASNTQVTATPEASDVAFAVVFGTGLMGLVIRARRRNA